MSHLELVALVVREYEPAIDFFVGTLGFELVEDVPSLTHDGRPKRWVVVRPQGGVTGILLARADGDHQAGVVGRQFSGRVGLFLRVDDFEVTYARMVTAGVVFVSAPRVEPYGKVGVFLDIEGNRWDLLGPTAANPPEREGLHGAMEITTLTAEHVLRYIFGVHGQDAPYGPIATTWPLFQKFLHLPTAATKDIATAQIARGETDDPRYVQFILSRQLTDEAGGYGPRTLSIQLAYYWELVEAFDIKLANLSSRDFASVTEFCAAVENWPQFASLDALPVQNADILVDEIDPKEMDS